MRHQRIKSPLFHPVGCHRPEVAAEKISHFPPQIPVEYHRAELAADQISCFPPKIPVGCHRAEAPADQISQNSMGCHRAEAPADQISHFPPKIPWDVTGQGHQEMIHPSPSWLGKAEQPPAAQCPSLGISTWITRSIPAAPAPVLPKGCLGGAWSEPQGGLVLKSAGPEAPSSKLGFIPI